MNISYLLEMKKPQTHFFQVTISVDDVGDDSVVASMPVWTPGAYEIADFPRHVRNLKVVSSDNKKINVQRKDKSSWRILNGNSSSFKISYEVYADELSVHTSHLDSSHGYVNGAGMFLYLDGYKDQVAELNIKPQQNWKISTGLEKIGENKYRAINYDILIDSPIEIGTHRSLFFEVAGKEHEIVLYGRGNEDEGKLKDDVKKIVEAFAKMMGTLPYKRYVFIYHLVNEADFFGGLEHLNSTSIDVYSQTFSPKEEYNKFLSVTSHEFFHLWNVKRLRPVELGPFNYQEEVYTTLLWLSEGVTNYYTWIMMLRGGTASKEEYQKHMMDTIRYYDLLPGTAVESAADSSFDSWIKLYRPSPNNVNSYVSYYLKGEILGMLLNARIIESTKGNKSLDDFFRFLLERYNKDGKGFTEKDVLNALKEVSGTDFTEFFDKYVRGTTKIDFDTELKKIGYSIKRGYNEVDGKEPEEKAYLGSIIKANGGKYLVETVLEGSPAFEYGLNARDELVAVNGLKFDENFTKSIRDDLKKFKMDDLKAFSPGEKIRLHIFRRREIKELEIVLGKAPFEYYKAQEIEGDPGLKYAEKFLFG